MNIYYDFQFFCFPFVGKTEEYFFVVAKTQPCTTLKTYVNKSSIKMYLNLISSITNTVSFGKCIYIFLPKTKKIYIWHNVYIL